MTDEELAGKLEEHAKHGSHAYPALLYAAAERLYAFSAECALLKASLTQAERALLKASLAQAEREAEAVAASEPFGYFRALPMGWEDCAETDEGAIPLYERPQPDRVAKLEAEVKWLRSQVSIEQDVARAAVYARIDAENERAEARAAAAPDLLEALQSILQIDAHGTPLQDRLRFWNAGRPALDKALSAIAKATRKEDKS